MKVFLFGIALLFLGPNLLGQTLKFTPQLPLPPAPQIFADFRNIEDGSVDYADVDNDNDMDIIVSGYTYNGSPFETTILYINDGNGNFLPSNSSSFDGVRTGDVVFADIDNDNDPDILLTGWIWPSQYLAKLYKNDGNGNFTLIQGNTFIGVKESSATFADVDGDLDLDVLITGVDSSGSKRTDLYLNDSVGVFSNSTSTFPGLNFASCDFADVDNDNDLDFILTGLNNSIQPINSLYLNDGLGNFSTSPNPVLVPVYYGSVAFADIDNDSDMDLFVCGTTLNLSAPSSQLYLNNGSGSFLALASTITNIGESDAAFGDINNDGSLDLLISGFNSSLANPRKSRLYLGNGAGGFSLLPAPFNKVKNSAIALVDIEGDNDLDVFITGELSATESSSELFVNNGDSTFSKVIQSSLGGFKDGSVDFADIDNDNDQDLIISGSYSTTLYRNDGMGNYSVDNQSSFYDLNYSRLKFKDVDNDNDQDLLISGRKNSGGDELALYKNNGNGVFSEVLNTPFPDMENAMISFGDVENDGDEDLFVAGRAGNLWYSHLYLNDGIGNYTLQDDSTFTLIHSGSASFVDLDLDNDLDLIINGNSLFSGFVTHLFQNDGNGNFTLVANTPFPAMAGFIRIADLDHDNDPDLLFAQTTATEVFLNNGSGVFSKKTISSFPRAIYTSDFADADGDGNLDILVGAYDLVASKFFVELLLGNGKGDFIVGKNTHFPEVGFATLSFSDIDSDNDPDVLITGSLTSPPDIARFFINSTCADFYIDSIQACSDYTWLDSVNYSKSICGIRYNYLSPSGCDSVVVLDLKITNVDTSISVMDSTLSANQDFATYQWLNCDSNYVPVPGAIMKDFKPLIAGNYAVEVSLNGCIDTSLCTKMGSGIGINERLIEQQVQLYPNPTNGKISLVFPEGSSFFQLRLIDIRGKLLFKMELSGERGIDLSLTQAPGIYWLELLNSNNEKLVLKVVKN